jgi:hypothetical protein
MHAGLTRMRKVSRRGSFAVWVSVILQVAWRYKQSFVQYGACAPSHSKMGTEVVGTLTHRTGVTPRVPHAFLTLNNRFTYERILCGCYACGPNPRAWKNPRDTKNAIKSQILKTGLIQGYSISKLPVGDLQQNSCNGCRSLSSTCELHSTQLLYLSLPSIIT